MVLSLRSCAILWVSRFKDCPVEGTQAVRKAHCTQPEFEPFRAIVSTTAHPYRFSRNRFRYSLVPDLGYWCCLANFYHHCHTNNHKCWLYSTKQIWNQANIDPDSYCTTHLQRPHGHACKILSPSVVSVVCQDDFSSPLTSYRWCLWCRLVKFPDCLFA